MPAAPIAKARLVGGRLCLDFTNTAGGWTATGALVDDRLNEYSDLVAWSRYVKLIDQRQAVALRRANARHVLNRARRLRLAIYRLCLSALGLRKPRAADLDCINSEVRLYRDSQRLAAVTAGFAWTRSITGPGLDRMLGPIAQSAADLLAGDGLPRLRMCPGENCGWLFEDASRNHSRQWCDMRMCGNLAKVRRFRQRSPV